MLEGDFLLPSQAVQEAYAGIPAAGRVRGYILYDDEAQIARNYLNREGEPQPDRARWSWNHSEWLRQEAERLGLPALAARPWETAMARALDLLETPSATQHQPWLATRRSLGGKPASGSCCR